MIGIKVESKKRKEVYKMNIVISLYPQKTIINKQYKTMGIGVPIVVENDEKGTRGVKKISTAVKVFLDEMQNNPSFVELINEGNDQTRKEKGKERFAETFGLKI